MPLTLYSVSDGPPSLAVRMALNALGVDFTLINVDFGLGEHMTEEYAQVFCIKYILSLELTYTYYIFYCNKLNHTHTEEFAIIVIYAYCTKNTVSCS